MEKYVLEIDKALYNTAISIEKSFLDSINPINAAPEKKEFFAQLKKNEPYEPDFKYSIRENFEHQIEAITMAEKSLTGNSPAEKLLKSRCVQMLLEIELIKSAGGGKFTNTSKKSYGKPSKKALGSAFEVLKTKTKREEKPIPSGELKLQLEKMLISANLKFGVELNEHMSAKASIRPVDGKIKLNSGAIFTESDAKRFFVHEVETHVYRHLNGLAQPLSMLSLGFGAEYLKTEEGLAAFNEEKSAVSSPQQKKIYAARAIAVDYALKHTFFETFDYLRGFIGEEEAYTITQRVKRGVPYSKKGAFTKDHCYFLGYLEVENYAKQGQSIENLYFGKISANEVGIVKKLPEIKKPIYLPKWLEAKNLILRSPLTSPSFEK